ncbi:MAG: hypothetical protein KAS04_07165 [Candidatus Aenigmarchaeota archaeon]|nr:hypothetical protein [Candidatus Aenigmarchaeota archaeon]
MYVNVICNKCTNVISWRWGDNVSVCKYCNEEVSIRDVTLVKGEVIKLFE